MQSNTGLSEDITPATNNVSRQSAVKENPKRCPECNGYFDHDSNGHIYLDGLPNRSADRSCRYREFGVPAIRLSSVEWAGIRRALDSEVNGNLPIDRLPYVINTLAPRRALLPSQVVGYDDGAGYLFLVDSIPMKVDEYWRQHEGRKQILFCEHYAGGKVECQLLVDGRPLASRWTKMEEELQTIIQEGKWAPVLASAQEVV